MISQISADTIAAAAHKFSTGDLSLAERTVALVFSQWPKNTVDDQVLAKVIVLNSLYSTSILDVKTAAKHIVSLNIDARCEGGDLGLVNDIARMKFGNKERNNLSFASKFCSWHQPEKYQIYDSFVIRLIGEYRKLGWTCDFRMGDLRNYATFMTVIDELRSRKQLIQVSRKALDQFLWSEGHNLVRYT